MNNAEPARLYLIYDGRARSCSTPDEAAVMSTCATLQEAQGERTRYGNDAVIFSYQIEGNETLWQLVDEREEPDT